MSGLISIISAYIDVYVEQFFRATWDVSISRQSVSYRALPEREFINKTPGRLLIAATVTLVAPKHVGGGNKTKSNAGHEG